jgi:hypothetical protein
VKIGLMADVHADLRALLLALRLFKPQQVFPQSEKMADYQVNR